MLETAQDNLIRTINDGPAVLDPQLFNGPLDRVLLGLRSHANTISHARLVALEETFPLTRQHLGEAEFNQLSRAFVETEDAQASDNNTIGKHFPDFLREHAAVQMNSQPLPHFVIPAKAGIHRLSLGFTQRRLIKTVVQVMDSRLCGNDEVGGNIEVDVSAIELARIEWAWLESYHAADADALALAAIAGLGEAALLDFAVAWHPATRLLQLTAPLSSQLPDLAGASAILIIRPEAEVRLLALDAATAAIAIACKKSSTIGNLLAISAEQQGIADPAGPVLNLIGAGALVARGVDGGTTDVASPDPTL
jgi:hypothetical protein